MTEQPRSIALIQRSAVLPSGGCVRRGSSIAPLAPATRFSLRMHEADAARLGQVGPFRLDMPVNACGATDGASAARRGANEGLLIASASDTDRPARELRRGLRDIFHALVDISHRNVAIAVAGTHAREVLNGGSPIDLRDGAFPPGSGRRTLLGKAEILLLRPGTEISYRVECWRSFAAYVHAFLLDAAREF